MGNYISTDVENGADGKSGFLNQSEDLPWFGRYKMDHTSRGKAVIFNVTSFKGHLLGTRNGSETDAEALKNTLEGNPFKFKVRVETNPSSSEIDQVLRNEAADNHRDNDCFVCIFLSHGDDGIIYGCDGDPDDDDTKVKLKEMFDLFREDNCPSLAGKPKIFIVQACCGTKPDDGVMMVESDAFSEQNIYEVEEGTVPTIPTGPDFLICFCTSKGFISFRNPKDGSWFIQDLVKAMEAHGSTVEFTKLLTYVNNLVAKRAAETVKKEVKKQMPCFLSMLTKQLFFTPNGK